MGGPAKILIVDDDESIRKVLATILEKEGYTVDTAETGKEAIGKTESNSYNLALIDVRLPDMDGTKLLAKLQETTPKTVKIMVTGYPSMRSAIEAVNRGAQGYILKPIKIENLLNIIRKHLTSKI
ncbi:MAG: response regulator [Candidatus Jordarchaeaceae archaeon]